MYLLVEKDTEIICMDCKSVKLFDKNIVIKPDNKSIVFKDSQKATEAFKLIVDGYANSAAIIEIPTEIQNYEEPKKVIKKGYFLEPEPVKQEIIPEKQEPEVKEVWTEVTKELVEKDIAEITKQIAEKSKEKITEESNVLDSTAKIKTKSKVKTNGEKNGKE